MSFLLLEDYLAKQRKQKKQFDNIMKQLRILGFGYFMKNEPEHTRENVYCVH